jgi:DNA-binding transcriptional ArsR family regulator
MSTMTLSASQAVDVLRAAGEPSRLRILALLGREELAVLELCRVLDQSQPRVSRHLKLLADAGLVERFPDGAWVFYRLTSAGSAGALVAEVLARVDANDPVLQRDADRLQAVWAERADAAGEYFARNAARWDEIRSLYVSDADVEDAILRAASFTAAARIVAPGGKLIIADFAPHRLEYLREQHQHRRLGFPEPEMARWLADAGLDGLNVTALPPADKGGLTVKIWTAERGRERQRSAA